MKKLFFLLVLCAWPFMVNAECTYSEKYELNALSSYIDYAYDYNESTGLFTINLFNIEDRLELRYENKVYEPENGEVIISNIAPGTRLSIDVYSTVQNECYNEYLRVIYVSIPYFNRFYDSILCDGYEELDICNSRFLDYQISNQTFILLLNNYEFSLNDKELDSGSVLDHGWFNKAVIVLKNNYLKIVICILSTVLSVSIFNVVYRKVKHKL